MKYFKQLIAERSILFLLLPFLFGIGFLVAAYGKGPAHLMVNEWNSPSADIFFKYFTNVGDGIIFALVIIILAFIKLRWAFYQLLAAVLTLITVYITKQFFFKGMPRPTRYFEGTETLHLVEGVKMHSFNTFPSGHTITAFAIFMILVLVIKNNYLKYLFVLVAILAGYSRVYLSQHFLSDVLAGSLMGLVIAVMGCTIVDNSGIFNTSWMDKNLFQLFNKKNDQ